MDGDVSYYQQTSFCGKERCKKCLKGKGVGHGPYWYAYQTINGRIKRTYIGRTLPVEALPFVETKPDPLLVAEQRPSTVTLPTGRFHRTPLVGRESERETLYSLLYKVEQLCDGTVSTQKHTDLPLDTQRTSQCTVLLGEPGIGKTRLAEELGRDAQARGWTVLWGRAYSQESGIPYRIWTDILRKALESEITPALLKKKVGGTSTTLAQVLPPTSHLPLGVDPTQPFLGFTVEEDVMNWSLQTILPGLWVAQRGRTARTPVEPEQEQLRLREAVRNLLTTIAKKKPVLVVLDDLQWTDGNSCELFSYLARHVYGIPILLLATCRATERQPSLVKLMEHMQREHTVTALQLNPLTPDEIAQLIGPLAPPDVERILVQAGGNPFFAEELARTRPPRLPDSISAALESRMNSLSEECRNMLRSASVLGNSFEFSLIHELETKQNGAKNDEDTLFDLLEEAMTAGVLTEEGSGVHIAYSFWHPLMVTHLYDNISGTRRKQIHRRVADILLRTHRGHEAEVAPTIAHHLQYGGADPVHVAHYAEVAGNRAYLLLAYSEAERYYQLALEKAKEATRQGSTKVALMNAPAHLAPLTERLAESIMVQGRFLDARLCLERVYELRLEELGGEEPNKREAQMLALLWGEIGRTWLYLGQSERSQEYYNRGEELLQKAEVVTGFACARMRTLQGGALAQQGQQAEALRVVKQALQLFQDANMPNRVLPYKPQAGIPLTRIQRTLNGDLNDLGRMYMSLGTIYNNMGQLNDALTHLSAALALFEEREQKREVANASCNIGYISLKKGEYITAQRAFERSLAIAEYIGDGPISSVVCSNFGELAACRGDLVEAGKWYKRALVLAEQFQDRTYISTWNAALAVVLQAQGQPTEAGVCIVRAFRVGRGMKSTFCIGNALLALAKLRILQAQQRPQSARLLLNHAACDIARTLALTGLDAETTTKAYLALAHTNLLLGNRAEAHTMLEEVVKQAHGYSLAVIEQQAWDLLDRLNKAK